MSVTPPAPLSPPRRGARRSAHPPGSPPRECGESDPASASRGLASLQHQCLAVLPGHQPIVRFQVQRLTQRSRDHEPPLGADLDLIVRRIACHADRRRVSEVLVWHCVGFRASCCCFRPAYRFARCPLTDTGPAAASSPASCRRTVCLVAWSKKGCGLNPSLHCYKPDPPGWVCRDSATASGRELPWESKNVISVRRGFCQAVPPVGFGSASGLGRVPE